MTEHGNERQEHLRAKMIRIKAREKAILALDKKQKRKERTRRLIQNGALAEKYLKCKEMTSAKFEKRLQEIVSKVNAQE